MSKYTEQPPRPDGLILVQEDTTAAETVSLSLEANKDREPPYAWIQFKGTDLCADIHCLCGAHLHLDAAFAYHIQCPYCFQVYECSGFITLYPVPATADQNVIVVPKDPLCDDFDTDDDTDQEQETE